MVTSREWCEVFSIFQRSRMTMAARSAVIAVLERWNAVSVERRQKSVLALRVAALATAMTTRSLFVGYNRLASPARRRRL
jgi:hypothetical protein